MVLPLISLSNLILRPFRREPAWGGGDGDIVAIIDSAGVIQSISLSAHEVIGAAGSFESRSLFDFIRREDRDSVKKAMQYALEGDMLAAPHTLQANFRLLRLRRAPALAEVTFKSHGTDQVKALIRERRRDVTRLSSTVASPARQTEPANEDRVPQPTDQKLGRDKADQDSSLQDGATMIMADLAHEMKTPLNAIMGFADAMRSQTFGPLGRDDAGARKYAEYLDHIHASGAHLTALIGAAQDYAKTQSGRYEICRTEIDPSAIALECGSMVRGAAEAAGLDLIIDEGKSLPTATLDERAVKQILINLLSNAVKFTETGSVTLSARVNDDDIKYIVSDTGVGMNKIVLSKLGGRYSDTHKQGVRGTAGTGLGLSLAFELAKLHGGDLQLTSQPGEGTTATLRLPRTPGHTLTAQHYGQQSEQRAGDIQSQLDRVNAFRRERLTGSNAA